MILRRLFSIHTYVRYNLWKIHRHVCASHQRKPTKSKNAQKYSENPSEILYFHEYILYAYVMCIVTTTTTTVVEIDTKICSRRNFSWNFGSFQQNYLILSRKYYYYTSILLNIEHYLRALLLIPKPNFCRLSIIKLQITMRKFLLSRLAFNRKSFSFS